jgi:hypothetical protein
MFGLGGVMFGGMFNKPAEMPGPPMWLPYIHVPDAKKTAEAVKKQGGQIINGPMEVPGGGWIAQGLDPQGGMFAVHSMKTATAGEPGKEKSPEKKSAAKKSAGKKPGPKKPPRAAVEAQKAVSRTAKTAVTQAVKALSSAVKAVKKAVRKGVKDAASKAAKTTRRRGIAPRATRSASAKKKGPKRRRR